MFLKLGDKIDAGSWFFLFLSTLILLPVMYYHSRILSIDRVNIAGGQYLFFIITLISSVIFLLHYRLMSIINTIKTPHFLLMISFFVTAAVSAFLGWTPYYGLRLLLIVLLTSLPFMIAGINSIKKPELYALPFLLYGLFVVMGTFITAYVDPIKIEHIIVNNYLWGGRWSFWFNQANGLGVIMALTISTLLYFSLIASNKKYHKIAIFIAILLSGFVLLKSGSRSALLWSCSSVVLYYLSVFFEKTKVFSIKKRIFFLFFFFAGAFLFCFSVFYCLLHFVRPGSDVIKNVFHGHTTMSSGITTAFASHSATDRIMNQFTSSRWNVWLRYFHQIKLTPFFGYGYGAEEVFLHHQPNMITGNIYIRLLGESGIFSLLIFLAILISGIYVSAKSCIKNWVSHPNIAHFALFVLMVLIGIGLEQMGDAFILRIEEMNYIFFFFIAAAWSLGFYHAKQ